MTLPPHDMTNNGSKLKTGNGVRSFDGQALASHGSKQEEQNAWINHSKSDTEFPSSEEKVKADITGYLCKYDDAEEVFVKTIRRPKSFSERKMRNFNSKFDLENSILAQLRHPGIRKTYGKLYDFGDKILKKDNLPALACRGELTQTLLRGPSYVCEWQAIAIADILSLGSKSPCVTALKESYFQVLYQLLSAVKYLHEKKVCHSSINIHNVQIRSTLMSKDLLNGRMGDCKEFLLPSKIKILLNEIDPYPSLWNDCCCGCSRCIAPELDKVYKNQKVGISSFSPQKAFRMNQKSDIYSVAAVMNEISSILPDFPPNIDAEDFSKEPECSKSKMQVSPSGFEVFKHLFENSFSQDPSIRPSAAALIDALPKAVWEQNEIKADEQMNASLSDVATI